MDRIQTLLHDPATLISVGVGFFILIVVALIFILKNRKRNTSDDSIVAAAASSAADGQVQTSTSPQGATDGQVVQTSATPQESAESAIKYNAMVFTDDGIKFKTVKQKLLTLVFCDPSMPKSGSRFLCVEKDGQIKGYDPRDSLIASNDTAQRAWRATHCKDIVRAMFQGPTTPWEKLNQVFMWVFCGGLLFLGIIALSRI